MRDLNHRFRADLPPRIPPGSAELAQHELETGNAGFAHLLDWVRDGGTEPIVVEHDLEDIGAAELRGGVLKQAPFGVVLGCSDARVPVEMIFRQRVNDLFVVRVAGNVLASEGMGSIDYAVQHFGDSVKLSVVLGHSGCGAISAAVDAYLQPAGYLEFASSHALRSIVDRIFIAVRTCVKAIETIYGPNATSAPGYRAALIEATVEVNAALAAHTLEASMGAGGPRVLFGVYDLATRLVRGPDAHRPGLSRPPASEDEFRAMLTTLLGGERTRKLLSEL